MATDPSEIARDQLALAQRASRAAFRSGLDARFAGSPVAYRDRVRDWEPVIEFQLDLATEGVADVDGVARNQDLVDL